MLGASAGPIAWQRTRRPLLIILKHSARVLQEEARSTQEKLKAELDKAQRIATMKCHAEEVLLKRLDKMRRSNIGL